MQIMIQAISFFVYAIVAIIIYQIFKRCSCMGSIVKYCFPILSILTGTHGTDLLVEVTTVRAHFTLTGYYPTLIRLSQQILKESLHRQQLLLF